MLEIMVQCLAWIGVFTILVLGTAILTEAAPWQRERAEMRHLLDTSLDTLVQEVYLTPGELVNDHTWTGVVRATALYTELTNARKVLPGREKMAVLAYLEEMMVEDKVYR
jgi:hypothetical protein